MTDQPNPGGSPEPDDSPRPRSHWIRRAILPVGVTVTVGVGAGLWWGWVFVNERLAPLVAETLSDLVNRPVSVGPVERVSLTGIRFGASSVPPTASDPDRINVAAIDVGFNPLEVLLTRKVKLDITLVQPDVYLEQDRDGTWVSTQFKQNEEKGPFDVIPLIRYRDGRMVLSPAPKVPAQQAATNDARRIPVILTQVNGQANFSDNNQVVAYTVDGQSTTGGKLWLSGETLLAKGQTKLQLRTQNLQLAELDRLIKPPVDLAAGRVSGTLNIQTRPGQEFPSLNGRAQVQNATIRIPQVPQIFTQATGPLSFRDTQLRLDQVRARFGSVPLQATGVIDFQRGFNLAGTVAPVSVTTVLNTLNLKSPVPVAGVVGATLRLTGPTEAPVLTGLVRSTRAGSIDRLTLDRYSAGFRLDTAKQTLTITGIQATPTAGGQITGSGQISLSERPTLALNFQAVNVPGDPIARQYSGGEPLPFTIGPVNAQARVTGAASSPQTLVRWQAPNSTYAGSGDILIAGSDVDFRNTNFAVAGGTLQARGQVRNGRWQAFVEGANISLRQFSANLQGVLRGTVALSGSLDSFSPSAIQAQGQVQTSQGIGAIAGPLTAQFRWNGQQLVLDQVSAPQLQARGVIIPQLEGAGAPAIAGFDLDVQASDYDLQTLASLVSSPVSVTGQADFAGRVRGTLANPQVNGSLALRQLAVNGIAFEPLLQGQVQVDRGVNLNLAGQRDRIAVTLDAQYQPLAFDIRRDQAVAQGRTQGGILQTEIRNFPLALLRIPGAPPILSAPSGQLNANLAINLNQRTASGPFSITQPSIGGFQAEQFEGRLSYANGSVTLVDGQLRRGDTVVQVGLTANLLGGSPDIQGQINVDQGNVQDILGILQIFELQDFARDFQQQPTYGRANALDTVPIETATIPLLTQLRRLAELQALQQAQESAEAAALVPNLRDLTGTFSGTVDFATSARTGIEASFNIRGQDWEWGRFSAKDVIAIGNFSNGSVTLLPLRLQSDDSVIAFSGQVGSGQQSGQLRVENVPIETISDFINSPVNITGQLDATATLSGNLDNPQAIGLLTLTNGTLNGTPIDSARGNFRYGNARLDFSSDIALVKTEPLYVRGSVPYQLPFAAVPPASDQINLNINVKNEGLALLNAFTNQVAWVGGQGTVQVEVRGTLEQPLVTGIAQVQDATFEARVLPDAPITDVDGVVRFDNDRIRVEALTGRFSRGSLSAKGILPLIGPLSPNDPDRGIPLVVALDQARLNLKGLYQGNVEGQIQLTGTAFEPILSGLIRLSNGQVILSDPPAAITAEATPNAAPPDGASSPTSANGGRGDGATNPSTSLAAGITDSPIRFDGLRIELGNAIQVTRPPIVNFVAKGDLVLYGSLNDLRPDGRIQLVSGQINLFTTTFNLERGYPQIAEFTPDGGLDPQLNVTLFALVPEVVGTRLPTSATSSEIIDAPVIASSYGSLQTVRVRAQVRGPVSQLSENLDLSSSPPRSEAEIVALIGGGFIDTLGRGNGLLGIANLAGSALLTNVQSFVANTLGLSEFRIFPTYVQQDRGKGGTSGGNSTLGLAVEAAINLTPSVSFSVLQVLTANQPTQFGLRYRVNRNVLLRGSTDFSGDSRAVVEYEARF